MIVKEKQYLLIEKKNINSSQKKLGKPLIYRYEPGVSKQPGSYYFANSSGNEIKNDKNLKLKKENIGKKFEDDLELDDNSSGSDNNNSSDNNNETNTELESELEDI